MRILWWRGGTTEPPQRPTVRKAGLAIPPEEWRKALADVRRLVYEMMAQLDTTKTECGNCGSSRCNNWSEFTLNSKLGKVLRPLKDILGELDKRAEDKGGK